MTMFPRITNESLLKSQVRPSDLADPKAVGTTCIRDLFHLGPDKCYVLEGTDFPLRARRKQLNDRHKP